jgi:GNAT superfamily N-acetyltransferase
MTPETPQVHMSAIDEKRFGMPTARASDVSLDTLPSIMDFCRTGHVVLLIARCMASQLDAAQAMEREGFLLMDTLVYYARDLVRVPIPADIGEIPVRPARPGEEHTVKAVAAEAFRGYFGHYHADERLERAKCDEIYPDWAFRSCVSRDVADEVLVAEEDASIVGLATLRLNSPEEGEGVLFGIVPPAQRRGIYRSFMIGGMEWCLSQGTTRMVVSTQITNVAVQKVWTRVGFEPHHAQYTFHKWFS